MATRIIDGVRFQQDADGAYRAEVQGVPVWVWRNDDCWHWGLVALDGTDINRGTDSTREKAMWGVIIEVRDLKKWEQAPAAPAAQVGEPIEQLYSRLDATRAAYVTASWDNIGALQAEQAAILDELRGRERARDLRRCEAAGLPASFALPR